MPSEIAVSLAAWSLLEFLQSLRGGDFQAWALVVILVGGLTYTAFRRGDVTSNLPEEYNDT